MKTHLDAYGMDFVECENISKKRSRKISWKEKIKERNKQN